jgi:hypothetical protein
LEWEKGNRSSGEVKEALRRRDRKWRLECDVGHFLASFSDLLVELFPEASFILTVRNPRSWLRSAIDQCINIPRENLLTLTPQDRWIHLRDYYYGEPPDKYPEEETPLAEYNLHTISGYLSYWADHNRQVIESIPSDRLLIVRTQDLSDSLPQIASIAGVSEKALNVQRSHSYQSPERHGVLEDVEETYIDREVEEHCREVAKELEAHLSRSLR